MTGDADQVGEEPEDSGRLPHFNLVKEPWIPVLMRDGTTRTLSLDEVFAEAPGIARVVGESPTITVAIEGILQAILRRALPEYLSEDPQLVIEAVSEHWNYWDSAAEQTSQYLEKWKDRFNLFDEKDPFFQAAELEKLKGGHDSLNTLISEAPGDEAFLTMRRRAGLESLSFPEAARWLVNAQAYDPSGIRGAAVGDRRAQGGRVYPTGPGWAALFGVIAPRTGTLHHDLLLATVPTGVGRLEYDPQADLPVWERAPLNERPEGVGDGTWETSTAKDIRSVRREPKGPADLLTWPARRVRLVREEGRVVGVVLAAGDPIDPQNRFTVEPRAAWRYSKPQSRKFKTTVYMPRESPISSDFWRGIEALFPRSVTIERPSRREEVTKFYGPAVSSWLAYLDDQDALEETAFQSVTFEVTGATLGSNRSVVDDLITDSLTLPTSLFAEENLRFRVEIQDWINLAEQTASAVAGFAADLARAAGAEDTDDLFTETRGDFLATARNGFLETLATVDLEDFETTRQEGKRWAETLRRLALEQRSGLLEALGSAALVGTPKGDQYLTAGNAERWFLIRINKLLGRDATQQQAKETSENE